ncbi:transporter substrate-binding domain-containing protein [Salinarimonas soli]|uniref:transporter substrate-binding domain-containing protein n=1 Tax=Salinarimonas soli TaxID=1638099 RepID=UPI003F675557
MGLHRILACFALLGLLVGVLLQAAPVAAQDVTIPNLWDPRARPERPDISSGRTIRFLTDDDFPPLNFQGPEGVPTGFVVELARAACERLGLTCTVQARRFDTLLPSLAEGRGDVVAAAVPITANLRQAYAVTKPLFRFPARFVTRRDRAQGAGAKPFDVAALAGAKVGVVGGTAHEAYLSTLLPAVARQAYPDAGEAQAALRRGEVDYVFGDGLTLALWVGGSASEECCALVGGPFLESRFFGEGIGFVLRADDDALRRALDFALQRLWDDGKYAELYLRFFPVGPF